MGKSFGVNSKAKEGRERKAAQKETKKREEQKRSEEKEAKEWEVGAKVKTTKQLNEERRKEEKERQKIEKERILAAEDQELSKIKPLKPLKSTPPSKLQAGVSLSATASTSLPHPINVLETSDDFPSYSASNIEDAIFLLEATAQTRKGAHPSKGLERHPERRAKAAYMVFESRELARLKAEFPSLRLSQLRERVQRLWEKAPENPFNQVYVAYNATKSQESIESSNAIEAGLEHLRISPS